MADDNQNFSLRLGEALKVVIDVSTNLTGFSAKWATARASARGCFGSVPTIEKCSGIGSITITDPVNGILEFTLEPGDTESLFSGNYAHQLAIVDGFDNPTIVTTGTMTLSNRLFNTC